MGEAVSLSSIVWSGWGGGAGKRNGIGGERRDAIVLPALRIREAVESIQDVVHLHRKVQN